VTRPIARSPRAVLLTDSNVAAHYLAAAEASLRDAGLLVHPLIIPPGEASKTLAQAALLYDALLHAGLDRGSVLVALGGGVVTDLGGFIAATYMRGIPWIAVPTTLLAQVDASVGGKTAVDHPLCKNLIGVFHQPSAVLADVSTLATLPDEEFRGGLAEVVKHAVIRDADLFDRLEVDAPRLLARDPAVLEPVVARNVAIKADVVSADEREGGLRRILNYGHTIGHAIEALLLEAAAASGTAGAGSSATATTPSSVIPSEARNLAVSSAITPSTPGARAITAHGRAVALGMMAETFIAVQRGIAAPGVLDRQRRLLDRFGLPTRLAASVVQAPGTAGGSIGASAPAIDVDRCLALMRHDKKSEAGRLRFVVPESIGATRELSDVTDAQLRQAILSIAR
jgi:3-dehydroquinate synthase